MSRLSQHQGTQSLPIDVSHNGNSIFPISQYPALPVSFCSPVREASSLSLGPLPQPPIFVKNYPWSQCSLAPAPSFNAGCAEASSQVEEDCMFLYSNRAGPHTRQLPTLLPIVFLMVLSEQM